MAKLDRALKMGLVTGKFRPSTIGKVISHWSRLNKFDPCGQISSRLGMPRTKVFHTLHHESHAASAYFPSPFDAATVITLDGVGEWETATISIARGSRINRLASVQLPDSLGLFYSAFTAFLGFEVNEGEYKVMGMAGFGTPRYEQEVRQLITVKPDGRFSVNRSLFDFTQMDERPYGPTFLKKFGAAREPESDFNVEESAGAEITAANAASRHYADIAASVQKATESVILEIVSNAVTRTGVRNVCLAGGVALNSAANARIRSELDCDLFVQPAAGDAGGAVGAALHHYGTHAPEPRRRVMVTAQLGSRFEPQTIRAALETSYLKPTVVAPDEATLVAEVAKRIAAGQVTGWFQGAAEWGPRALGSRSILADPRDPDMKERINEKIKFREPFRPFAPAVLAESATDYFALPGPVHPWSVESFMLSVVPVRPDVRDQIPAVTHVDGTARVQMVFRNQNTLFYKLIRRLGDTTGVPIVLNTSFNLRGAPIVGAPQDAIETFLYSFGHRSSPHDTLVTSVISHS